MKAPKVVVTGAGGFVGEAVVFRLLHDRKFLPVAAVRGPTRLSGLCPVVLLDLSTPGKMPLFNDVQVLVHAAARVHIMERTEPNELAMFRKINVDGTLALARHAAESGVQRFIYISSIKVNGETTEGGKAFAADDDPKPLDPYGVSKYEAEEGLKRLCKETGMELVIIRPPLVYGPGVKANFLSMMNLLSKGLPLPFGSIRNKRSLVAIGNLVDLIVTCIEHPAAADQTFMVSDGQDLSTTELLRYLARAMDKKPYLVPVPRRLLIYVACVLGKQAIAQRVCGSLQVDIEKNREILGWSPPVAVEKAMLQTARFYLDNQKK
ncbi:UDP-glucose 4-epimerase family protein [Pseudomonas fluorescens group sp. PF-69]